MVHTDQTQALFQQNAFETCGNTFQVQWDDTNSNGADFPRATTQCTTGCTIPDVNGSPGDTCLCDVDVKETVIFGSGNGVQAELSGYSPLLTLPTRAEIEKECLIGSADPAMVGAGLTLCSTAACTAAAPDVKVWLATGADRLDASTVFQIRIFGEFFAQSRRTCVVLADFRS